MADFTVHFICAYLVLWLSPFTLLTQLDSVSHLHLASAYALAAAGFAVLILPRDN